MIMDTCLAALSLLCVKIRRAKLRLPDEMLIARITKFCEIQLLSDSRCKQHMNIYDETAEKAIANP